MLGSKRLPFLQPPRSACTGSRFLSLSLASDTFTDVARHPALILLPPPCMGEHQGRSERSPDHPRAAIQLRQSQRGDEGSPGDAASIVAATIYHEHGDLVIYRTEGASRPKQTTRTWSSSDVVGLWVDAAVAAATRCTRFPLRGGFGDEIHDRVGLP